jgi:NADH dehydrogenase FAD-containing subunit
MMRNTVAVIGGGYGGSAVAKVLDLEADVVLIDPQDAFINSAATLRALVRPDWAENIVFPYGTLLERGKVIRDRAVSVDPGGVTLASGGRVDADYLVLATGSSYAYPGKPNALSAQTALENLRQTHKELAQAGRVLILGAGPVGLELAGEIKEVWPDKQVTIVDPVKNVLAGYRPEVRADLDRQLSELGVRLCLGTTLAALPPTKPGLAGTFTVTTASGDPITADIWFRAHGVLVNSEYLADGRLTPRTALGQVPVTESLNVQGYAHVFAVGDITDVAEEKRAGYAMMHGTVVAENIGARIRGEAPAATYQPRAEPMIMLNLGPRAGVGQLHAPNGVTILPAATVSAYKGAEIFTPRFAKQFGRA